MEYLQPTPLHIVCRLVENLIFIVTPVKIIIESEEAVISLEKPRKKTLKARGIFNEYADTDKIAGEKGAWERGVVERYENNNS